MILSTIALAIILASLKWLGLPPSRIYDAMPYLTLGLLVYSTFEACRQLQNVYDIRLRGAPPGEQNHRHRR